MTSGSVVIPSFPRESRGAPRATRVPIASCPQGATARGPQGVGRAGWKDDRRTEVRRSVTTTRCLNASIPLRRFAPPSLRRFPSIPSFPREAGIQGRAKSDPCTNSVLPARCHGQRAAESRPCGMEGRSPGQSLTPTRRPHFPGHLVTSSLRHFVTSSLRHFVTFFPPPILERHCPLGR